MNKKAQYSSLAYTPEVRGKTLADLYLAIRADAGLDQMSKIQLIEQIQQMVGYASASTPISALMMKGLGGTIGWIISKYFGMGTVGQLISSLAGIGLGSSLSKKINEPEDQFPGWKMM